MNRTQIEVISVIAALFLIAFASIAYADTGVPSVPEIQGLVTGTASDVLGTVTETDSGAWSLTNDPSVIYSYSFLIPGGVPLPNRFIAAYQAQLQSAGGSLTLGSVLVPGPLGLTEVTGYNIPQSLLNTQVLAAPPGLTWQDLITNAGGALSGPVIVANGLHSGTLNAGQVQYTIGYYDQYAGVSGQQTFVKSMALSTAHTIADQSNLKANTNIQFISVDTGRATRSEDLLLDGAAQAQNSSGLILCPFADTSQGIVPAFCNIAQAGSSFDTSLTSTVTSADTRFVGADATIPTVLNYNIDAEGIAGGNQSYPMIGSVSAFLKVHVQEARNESVNSGIINQGFPTTFYSFPDGITPAKSEDLVYSETSSASGLIGRFSKSMSYSSQASAVPPPPSVFPGFIPP